MQTKKVLAAFLLIIVIITNFTAYAQLDLYPDITEDSNLMDAVSLLRALNIMEGYDDGTFRPEQTVTRAEIAKLAARLLALDGINEKSLQKKFLDVAEDHWAYTVINTLSHIGIMTGFGDATFRPEEMVTFEQAVKLLVSILGYEIIAAQRGGFPAGYMIVASEKGLFKGIEKDLQASQKISRGILARLIYNALDIPILDQVGFGNNIEYHSEREKTLLTEKLGIEKGEGKVTGISTTGLATVKKLREHEIEIDNVVYTIDDLNAKDLLGCIVEYYYEEDSVSDNEYKILYIRLKPGRNIIETVTADHILSFKNNILTYYKDKENDARTYELKVSNNADVIFNGVAVLGSTDPEAFQQLFMIDSGYIEFVDNNNDGDYELVKIRSYIHYVVDQVMPQEKKVFDKYNRPYLNLDADQLKGTIEIFKDGKRIELSDLKEWDVLAVAADKEEIVNGYRQIDTENSKHYEIIVVNSMLKGIVTELNEDKVIIHDREYEISPTYKMAVDTKQVSPLMVEQDGTWLLDISGKIAALKTGDFLDKNYGVVVQFAKEAGVKDSTLIKMFTADGQWLEAKCADHVIYDGLKIAAKDVYDRLNSLTTVMVNGRYEPTLIAYELNSYGEIKMIDTIHKGENEDEENSLKFDINKDGHYNIEFKRLSQSFSGLLSYNAGDPITIINVPVTNLSERKMDTDNLKYYRLLNFTDDFKSGSNYTVDAFNVSDVRVSKLFIRYMPAEGILSPTERVVLVDRVTEVTNDEGDKVFKIIGYKEGEPFEMKCSSEVTIEDKTGSDISNVRDIKRGSLIRAHSEAEEITQIQINFVVRKADNSRLQLNDRLYYNGSSARYDSELRLLFGKIYAAEGDRIVLAFDEEFTITPLSYKLHKCNIYIYDELKDKIMPGSYHDLLAYTKTRNFDMASSIVLQSVQGEALDLVIVKYKD